MKNKASLRAQRSNPGCSELSNSAKPGLLRCARNDVVGASLIELLLSISLGLWLLAGIIFIYTSNKKTYTFDQALTRIQENGRIAAQFLSYDIRMAGFIGCIPLNEFNFVSSPAINFSNKTRVVVWRDGQTTSDYVLPASIMQNFVKGTDILLIQAALPDTKDIVSASVNSITFRTKTGLELNDKLIISDCQHAELTKVSAVNGNSIQTNEPLIYSYANNSQASRFVSIVYYIRKTDRKNQTGQWIYSLYRRDLNQSATVPQELIEGAENMQILLGVERDNQLQYLSADQLTSDNWKSIKSVHIALLLNSLEAVNEQPMSYQFNQQKHNATDRLLRKEWDLTAALREPI